MMGQRKISVIITVYNVEEYLDKCLQSVVGQSYTNLEILLIDDGSPDGCPQLCDDWASRDSRIKVIHKINGGLSDARNAGLDIATGDYIAFVDSDDWIEPDTMEGMVRAMEEYQADIVNCQFLQDDDAGGKNYNFHAHEPMLLEQKEALLLLMKDKQVTSHVWRILSRRELWKGIRFPYGKAYEDVLATQELFLAARRFVFLDNAWYHYRVNDSSITHTIKLWRMRDFVEAFLNRKDFVKKHLPEYLPEFEKMLFQKIYMEWRDVRRRLKTSEDEELRKVLDYLTPFVVSTPFGKAPGKKFLRLLLIKIGYFFSRKAS